MPDCRNKGGAKACMEMQFSCKSSYFLDPYSDSGKFGPDVEKQLMAKGKASKDGIQYGNSALYQ